MDTSELAREIAALPPEAQQQVAALVAALKARGAHQHGAGRKRPALADEPFIGMWRDREELRDSSAWVRQLRREEWERTP